MKAAEIRLTARRGEPHYYRVTLDTLLANPRVRAVVLEAPVRRMTWRNVAGEERRQVPMSDRRDGALVRVEQIGPYRTSAIRSQDGVVDRESRTFDVGEEYYVALAHVDREWTDDDEARLQESYTLRARVEAVQDRMLALGIKATVAAQPPNGRVGMPLAEFERLMTVAEGAARVTA